jgi:hypothetical protein
MSDYKNVPDFDSLPKVGDMPQGCAWGIFDKDGKKDHLGTLNYITPEVVKEAAAEVKAGVSVSLNWPIGAINTPGFARKGLDHTVLDFMDTPFKIHGFDDEVAFNTQCSSQWDSLVHFAHQPTGLSYNGVKPSVAALKQDFGAWDHEKTLPTLNHWHERGGLVARGVLLDYVAYAEAKGIKYSPFENHPIDVATLEDIKKHQGLEFKHGDVLIVHSGFTDALGGASAEEQEKMLGTHSSVGVEGTEASARWIWNNHFSAVAGDAIAFENLPPQRDGVKGAGSINELGERRIVLF